MSIRKFYRGSLFRVTNIGAGSLWEKSGLKVGDLVAMIDLQFGISIAFYSFKSIKTPNCYCIGFRYKYCLQMLSNLSHALRFYFVHSEISL